MAPSKPETADDGEGEAPAACAAGGNDVDLQMQQVLELLSDRTKGNATNEEVERAVSQILSTAGLGPPPVAASSDQTKQQAVPKVETKQSKKKPPKAALKPVPEMAKIELDTENYDDDEEDEDEDNNVGKDNNIKKETTVKFTSATTTTNTSADGTKSRKRKRATPAERAAEKERIEQYDDIPLGRQGASMMTSFGDGANPKPEVVAATLLGARRLLQVTVQDARALRRKTQEQFRKAQADVAKYSKPNKSNNGNSKLTTGSEKNGNKDASPSSSSGPKQQQQATLADPVMLYRAFTGYDKLSYAPVGGFDYEQLMGMYPEEMRAYARWNQLRDEYASKSDDKEVAVAQVDNDESQTEKEEDDPVPSSNQHPDTKDGGHLQERAVQFDVRTNLMDQGWYMKFSEHRKGSFLPRRLKQEGDNEWEEKRKRNSKGKHNGQWAKMTANSARFLHWVGFDPKTGLPPPNEETTHALAFLGYDFFGRIVEQAIFLKNLAKAKQSNDEVDERTILLELEDGEQLEKADIDEAMKAINPHSLYSTAGEDISQKPVAQLYFGPGFEDRLELELDELMCGSTQRADISEEEAKTREQEDTLFSSIAAPPSINNAVMHLLGKDESEEPEAEASSN